MSQFRDDEIRRFIQRETSQRRLRPEQDEAKRREARRIKKALQDELASLTWRQFEEKISAIGATPGTEAYEQFRSLYRDYQQYLSDVKRGGPRRP